MHESFEGTLYAGKIPYGYRFFDFLTTSFWMDRLRMPKGWYNTDMRKSLKKNTVLESYIPVGYQWGNGMNKSESKFEGGSARAGLRRLELGSGIDKSRITDVARRRGHVAITDGGRPLNAPRSKAWPPRMGRSSTPHVGQPLPPNTNIKSPTPSIYRYRSYYRS